MIASYRHIKSLMRSFCRTRTSKQRFEHDQPNNAVKYVSTIKRSFKAQCSFTVLSSVNNVVGFYICVVKSGQVINPVVDRIAESEVYVTASGSRPDASFVQAIIELEENDKVYLAVENVTATNAVTITFLNLVIEQTVSLPFSCLFTAERQRRWLILQEMDLLLLLVTELATSVR